MVMLILYNNNNKLIIIFNNNNNHIITIIRSNKSVFNVHSVTILHTNLPVDVQDVISNGDYTLDLY